MRKSVSGTPKRSTERQTGRTEPNGRTWCDSSASGRVRFAPRVMVERQILHVDLDAFFASVEQRDAPELRGKPVLVGGAGGRGVVAAASYEARVFGVRSAMPMAEALRRCPEAIVVSPTMGRYQEASTEFFAILDDFSPLVEGLSVDEAFVDITGTERLLGGPRDVALAIKRRVVDEVGLVASVGIAPTKFVAKIASDIRKPDGLCIVEPDDVLTFLHALPVKRLWGVGAVAQEKLAKLGLHTIGDVANYPQHILEKKLGKNSGAHLGALARGQDSRSVTGGREAVSIGHEQTFESDRDDLEYIENILLAQCDKVARRLRKHDYRARTIVLKIRFADFNQVTRRQTLDDPSSDSRVLFERIRSLLRALPIDASKGRSGKVRLCGVSAANLEERDAPRQLGFAEAERARGEALGDVMDQIQDRFGNAGLGRASHTKAKKE
ncbi:MAG: DNA polymerase IV [Myxococcales bacterium]|nr:DNA polymerase IV [Myxococcales bacterium]